MPRVSRTRVIAAPRERVWDLVSDPHHLPRWWPRAMRVEDVTQMGSGKRSRWTTVLGTERGKGVRADYRCTSAAPGERYLWEQDLEGTPFERILRYSRLEILLDDGKGGTSVKLASSERLRGLSRLGSPMMRMATRKRLDEALDGIERAVGES
ncbi:MAG TPA: SRPBCC family protein [Solirubrobacterales bacterium]|nr:SRPBCC family protein [Solirubrobacterales bacterium]